MLLANLIFNAPAAAYLAHLILFPLLILIALGLEFWVFRRLEKGAASAGKLLGIVVLINIASWFAGFFLSLLLPRGYSNSGPPRFIEYGPDYTLLAILSFPFACVVSALLEYGALRLFFPRLPFRRPFRTVVLANLTSYAAIGMVVAAGVAWRLF